MKLLYDNVLVEQLEDEGVLKMFNDQYIVVKVKQLPVNINDRAVAKEDVIALDELRVGQEILCNNIRDYLVKGKKIYIVKLNEIVCIL